MTVASIVTVTIVIMKALKAFNLPGIELCLGVAATHNVKRQLSGRRRASAMKYRGFNFEYFGGRSYSTFSHRPVLEEDHQPAVEVCHSSESYDQPH